MADLEVQLARLGRSALALLEGASPGAGVRRTVDVQVHSVFRRVVNFRSSGDRLFALAAPGVPCAPNSMIATSAPASERGWFHLGLVPGALLRLTVDTSRAEVYEALIHRLGPDAASPDGRLGRHGGMVGALCAIANLAAASPLLNNEVFAPAARPCLARLAQLAQAAAAGSFPDTAELAATAGGLLGLGPGLTPSGDDLLAGFMVSFATACLRAGRSELALEVVNKTIIRATPGRTGELSLEFLRHAALGEGNELLDALLGALCAGDQESATAAAEELAQVGATSGLDQLLGICIGFAAGARLAIPSCPALQLVFSTP